jgi:hypothetical protein
LKKSKLATSNFVDSVIENARIVANTPAAVVTAPIATPQTTATTINK